MAVAFLWLPWLTLAAGGRARLGAALRHYTECAPLRGISPWRRASAAMPAFHLTATFTVRLPHLTTYMPADAGVNDVTPSASARPSAE